MFGATNISTADGPIASRPQKHDRVGTLCAGRLVTRTCSDGYVVVKRRRPFIRVLSENVLACARRDSDRGLCLGENVHQLVVRRAPDDTGFGFRSKDLVTRARSLDLLSPQCGTCERG